MQHARSVVSLAAAWSLVAAVALTGCSAEDTAAAAAGQPVTVVSGSRIAASLRQAGFTAGVQLPSGWRVDEYGATGDDRWLGVSVTDDGHRWSGTASVAIDTARHVAYLHQQVDPGWYSGGAVALDGWLVHQEKQQLTGAQCAGQGSDDCFAWRLYAERAAGGGGPRLLAGSWRPGSQLDSPIPVIAGGDLVWCEGSGHGYDVRSWTPGAASVRTLTHLARFGDLFIDGGRTVIVQRRTPDSSDWAVRAADASTTTLGVFAGRATIGLSGHRLLTLPEHGEQDQAWRIGTLRGTAAATEAATSPIDLRSFDALQVGFVDSRTAYAQTETALDVIDAATGRVLARIPTRTSFSIARVAGRRLTIVRQAEAQPAVVLLRG